MCQYTEKRVYTALKLPQNLTKFSIRENKFLHKLIKIVIREIKFPSKKHFWSSTKISSHKLYHKINI